MEYSAWSVAHGVQRLTRSQLVCLARVGGLSERLIPSRIPIIDSVKAPRIMACGNAAKRQRFGAKLRGKSIRKRSFTTGISRILLGKCYKTL